MKLVASLHAVAFLLHPSNLVIQRAAAFQITQHRRHYCTPIPPPLEAVYSPKSIREHLVGKSIRHSTVCFSSKSNDLTWESRQKCWRPTIQDVERISFGKPAKKKGTGSRGVPHRLNEDERLLFDQARRKGFLEVGGSGWRSQRRDAPLVNTYRSLCDARAQACIALHKGNTGLDELVIDLSPLRLPGTYQVLEQDVIDFVGLEAAYRASEENEKELSLMDKSEVEIVGADEIDDDAFDSRPIYQLPTHCICFEVGRSDGKGLGKKLAQQFNTIEANASKSRKPMGVKPGKNRRSGGYGIG